MEQSALLEALAAVVGTDRVLTDVESRTFYSTDVFRQANELALAVVQPGSVEELHACVRVCVSRAAPMVVRGGGASYTDGYLPTQPGTVLFDMSRLTGIATSIRDHAGQAITDPAEKPWFCGLMQSTPSGLAACRESHAQAAALVESADQPCRASCYAGLCQSVAPILLQGRHIGTIIVGDRPEHQLTPLRIESLATAHGIDMALLTEAAEELRPWSEERMAAATRFVQQLANTIARLCFNAYQLRCRMDDLAAVHDVAVKLSGRTRLQEILDTATKQLVETMELKAS